MNPATLETVTNPLIYTIGKIGLAVAVILIALFLLLTFLKDDEKIDNIAKWFAGAAVASVIVFGGMASYGAKLYNDNARDATAATLSEVESDNGVTLLGTDEITYKRLQSPDNIIPVIIDIDGNLFDGRLRVDNAGNIILFAPAPQDAETLVPFDSEEFRAALAED